MVKIERNLILGKRNTTLVKALICDSTTKEPMQAFVLELDVKKEAILNIDLQNKTELEIEKEIEERLWEGKLVELRVLAGSKGVVLYTGIVSYILKERIHIRELKAKGNIQRRKDVKAKFTAQSELCCISADIPGEINITLRDISAGGIGFYADKEDIEKLIIDEEYQTIFDGGDVSIALRFVLRWFTEMEDGKVNCGGEFNGLKNVEERVIRKFVFDKERQERKVLKEEMEREEELRALMKELEKEKQIEEEKS